VIDLHSHILPGLDDGPDALEGSLAMARAAVAGGTHVIAATPHINHHFAVDPMQIPERVAQLNASLRSEGIPLEVVKGGEIAIPTLARLDAEALHTLRLGDGPFLLLEAPLAPVTAPIDELVLEQRRKGHQVLLAHPERSLYFHQHPERLATLVEGGVRTSITAGALVGRFGETVRKFTLRLFAEGLVHDVASDAHDAARRPPQLLEGFERGDLDLPGLLEQADWYARAAPAAMLAGEALPEAPELLRAKRRLLRLRRG
jgi:protein-tyrosine phosphatase